MPDAIEFTLDDGTTVAVATARPAGTTPVGAKDRLTAAHKTLREAIAPVTAAAAQVMDEFRNLGHCPDEVEIAFGVTLDGSIGGIIASASVGAHLDVTLRWTASAEPPSSTAAPPPRPHATEP